MSEEKDPFEPIVGKFNFPGKNERETLNAIISQLNQGIMAYCSSGKMTVSDYLYSILRSKGETDRNPKDPRAKVVQPSSWNNNKFLGKIEKTNEELSVCPPELWGNDEKDTFDYKAKY